MSTPLPVRDAYDRWAAVYDTDVNATRDLDAAVLRATALPLDGAIVVEFGAGTGKNTAYLARRAGAVTALDLSEAMLDRARTRVRAAHVRFLRHDITTPWPVPEAGADLVVGNLVLEHVGDLAPVFTQARRALRAGGLLVISELHPYRQWRGSGAKFDDGTGERRVDVHIHAVSDYVTAALAAGFDVEAMAEIGDEAGAGAGAQLPRLLQIIFQTN